MADYGAQPNGLDPNLLAYIMGQGQPAGAPPMGAPPPIPQGEPPPIAPPAPPPIAPPAAAPAVLPGRSKPGAITITRELLGQGGAPAGGEIAQPVLTPPPEVPLTKQPGTTAPPPVVPVPQGKPEDMIRAGQQAQQAAITDEGKAAAEQAKADSDQARAVAGDYQARNEALYGKPDPKTGIQTGGLIAERQAQQAKAEADLAAKTQAVTTAVDTEAKYKIDDNRRWSNLSTGRKLLAGIGVLFSTVGQAMAGKDGSENPALKYIMGTIKDDVESQVRERDELKSRIGFARNTLDDYQKLTDRKEGAMNLKIAEEYKRTADQIEQESAKYADAKIKATAQMAAAQLRERAGSLVTGAAHEAWQRDYQKTQQAEEIRSHRANEYNASSALAQNDRHFAAQMTQAKDFHADEVNEKAAQLALAGRKEDAAELKAKGGRLQESGFMIPTGITKAADGSAVPKFDWLKQQDGTEYEAPKEAVKELRPKYEGTIKAVDAIDNLRKMIRDNGGNVNTWSTDARQKVAEYERALVGAHAAAGIAGFRGNVMEVMAKQLLGGAEPTSVIADTEKLLGNARTNIVKDLRGAFQAANYSGDPKAIDFPDPIDAKAPTRSQQENDLGKLRANAPGGVSEFIPEFSAKGFEDQSGANKAGITRSQKQVLDGWAGALSDPDQAPAARKFLEGIINAPERGDQSVSPAIHKYVRGLLGKDIVRAAGGVAPPPDPYQPPNPAGTP